MKFYNSHIHTFTDKDIPDRFLPLGLVKILRTKLGAKIVGGLLKNILPFTDEDMFDRYVRFVEIGRLGSQKNIFNTCKSFYPSDTQFVVLPMDMAFMGAGKVPRKYDDQIKELAQIAKEVAPQVIPFIHVDPRRDNILQLLHQSVEEWGFKGVKLYPPLGYFPYDERLYPVYEYCQQKNLPIIAHCSPYNPVRFKGSDAELKKLLSVSKVPIDTKGKKRKELCSYFTNPLNYKYVVKDFPNLKICLAHFGSAYFWDKYIHEPELKDNWFVYIKELIETTDNFYTDISFTLNNQQFFPLLKILLEDEKIRRKVLFGSDYYMVETEADERRFGLDLRAYIGEQYFKAIAIDNVQTFLGEPVANKAHQPLVTVVGMQN